MRLAEALQVIRHASGPNSISVELACGCTVLHLATFLSARLRLRFPEVGGTVKGGVFGDLEGNLARASQSESDGALAIIEWSDLDPRLGFRSSALWNRHSLDDIVRQVAERCARLERLVSALSRIRPVAVVGPGLPLPPLHHVPSAMSSGFELQLLALTANLLNGLGTIRNVRVVSDSTLAAVSPPGARHDIVADLRTGCPYTLAHSDALAALAVTCLFPEPPRKGLITDLDGTLWKGILGDVGVDGVSWTLDAGSHEHAIYQNLLASLAGSGVLLAVASKNDPDLVQIALQRNDLLVSEQHFFPVEASWGTKSGAVRRILDRWNVGAESVVFVDDSPMELAEVAEAHPGLECLQFPADTKAIPAFIRALRDRFGKPLVLAEDQLRQASIRASATLSARADDQAAGPDDFSERLGATLTVEPVGDDGRALELVNKTNQFNLNGERYTETAWRLLRARPGGFATTVAYVDRFGPLGRIAVLAGLLRGDTCEVDVWVLSCRAFSRQVESHTVRYLFDKTGAKIVCFRHHMTARNGPVQTFLAGVGAIPAADGALMLEAGTFKTHCPPLFHKVIDTWTM